MVGRRGAQLLALSLSWGGAQGFLLPASTRILQSTSRGGPLLMAIRGVHDYDSSFTLQQEQTDRLRAYLQHPDMGVEVCVLHKQTCALA
jgi:hypothetical protein